VAVRAGSAAAHAADNAADADVVDDSDMGLIQGGDDRGRTGGRASSTAHKEGDAAVDTSDSAGAACAADSGAAGAGAADAGSDNDNDDGASCRVIQSDFSFSFLSRRR
jgi:hypothetical protein